MKVRKPQMTNKIKRIDSSADPYLSSGVMSGVAICQKCHAVFHNKRWSIDEDLYKSKKKEMNVKSIQCPACKKVRDKFPGGILKLKGAFLQEHINEIMNLIRNEEQKAMGFNPLERIMDISMTGKGVEITTTNEKLAQRIGKSIKKAYQGKVAYRWSDDTKLLRAEWER
jgi:NMD protein affecting ribosome stability and mRNA decay